MHALRTVFAHSAFTTLAGVILSLISCLSYAQTEATIYNEQGKLIRAPRAVAAIGADLFGDKVNLYSGALEFTQTDVNLPGNDALPVALGRRLVTGSYAPAVGAFGRWELEIPHLHGLFATATGWRNKSYNTNRCTEFSGAPDGVGGNAGNSGWNANEYWHGNMLYVPGVGDQEMLLRASANTNIPSSGGPYPVVTRDLWAFQCLSTLKNGVGQGFVAISPDGTTYRFDWLVTRAATPVTKPVGEPQGVSPDTAKAPTPDAYDGALLARSEVWIMPTLVKDRFGNTVTYTYDSAKPANLKTMQASDGRLLTLHYASDANGETNRIDSVTDGTRTWTYSYVGDSLDQVNLPDKSAWRVGGMDPTLVSIQYVGGGDCDYPGTIQSVAVTGTMVHPSGATGTFTLTPVRHGRSKVFYQCAGNSYEGWTYPTYPRNYDSFSLTTKSITGPGLAPLDWTYDYGPDNASWENGPCGTCLETVTTTVTNPKNDTTRYTFGNRFRMTEGQLQVVDVDGIRVTRNRYRAPNTGEFFNPVGTSDQTRGDSELAGTMQPLDQRVITQQGVDFTWEVPAGQFDTKGRPKQIIRSSTLGTSRTETTVYEDLPGKWLLGHVKTVSEASSGKVMVSNGYDPTTGNLLNVSRFGRLEYSMTYNPDGTLATRKDGLGHITSYTRYKRGLPQNIAYPNYSSESVVVNDIGLITSHTNAAGFTTGYGYDAMGRVASISYPTADTVAWNPTTITFAQSSGDQLGLPAGHWYQTIKTGNGYETHYFDALWRPVFTERWDNAAVSATMRIIARQFDFGGRKTYESYPKRSFGQLSDGVHYEFDALGRPTVTSTDSELGMLYSGYWYGDGFQKIYTDARQHNTTYSYQAFDEPSESAISSIAAPEGVKVAIVRDVFGKTRSITRSGAGKSATRSYVYDAAKGELLCKTIEPETGATVQDYDAANNLSWRATGLALPSTTACDTASVAAAKKISFRYDTLNRLTSTAYGDASPAITRSYTADGLPSTITSNGAVWTNTYNKRRLNERENLAYGGVNYIIDRTYDPNASLLQLRYPKDNLTLAYNPNALGEPSQIGAYASAITYHPNGAVASFSYGNGVAHRLTQNRRGLPQQSIDSGVINDVYSYDPNANVAGIADQQLATSNRSMGYDGLDRLTGVSAPNLWGNAGYTYDALDNLTATTISGGSTARSTIHTIDAATNRLASISNGLPGYNFSYVYDSQGNITKRGSQIYTFDQGNRMKSAAGKATYAYDGLGHRMSVVGTDGVNRVQVYSQEGQLLYAGPSSAIGTKYIYLHNHVIAEVGSSGTTYDHTDGLGSPVAQTNSAGTVLNRTRYEPYGYIAAGSPRPIGFTGHVNDNDTGLVYMQQRYYDSFAGRMLSIDPITTDANTAGNFNRYAYANNSPYKYIDPDGRQIDNPSDPFRRGQNEPGQPPRDQECGRACRDFALDTGTTGDGDINGTSGRGPNIRGSLAVDTVEAELIGQGMVIIGREEKAMTPGLSFGRRYDLVVTNPVSRTTFGVEVKSTISSAFKLDPKQVAFDVQTIKFGATTLRGVNINGVMYRGVDFGTKLGVIWSNKKLVDTLVGSGVPFHFAKTPLP